MAKGRKQRIGQVTWEKRQVSTEQKGLSQQRKMSVKAKECQDAIWVPGERLRRSSRNLAFGEGTKKLQGGTCYPERKSSTP